MTYFFLAPKLKNNDEKRQNFCGANVISEFGRNRSAEQNSEKNCQSSEL